jgi:hypothetical protein
MLDPSKRISASDALKHAWFSSEPSPQNPTNLPIVNCNELYIKEKKRKSNENLNIQSSKKIKSEYDNFKKYKSYKNEEKDYNNNNNNNNNNNKEYHNNRENYKNYPDYKKNYN